jgi:hypothetical protein
VDDYRTSVLMHKIMKVGYIHFGNLSNSLLEFRVDLIQSSSISSFLCNMFGKFVACFKSKVFFKAILNLIVNTF